MRQSTKVVLQAGACACAILGLGVARAQPWDVQGFDDGPQLSGEAAQFAQSGYQNRSVFNESHSDDHAVGFSEPTGDDHNLHLRMDPISGELSADVPAR